MKNIKKILIIGILSLLLLCGAIFGFYKIFKDKNSLTISEKTWISNNHNSVYTINVPNDVNVFGKSGNGVFFDFIKSLDEDLDLSLNSSVYSVANKNTSLGFNVDTSYDSRDLLFYTDYYVLISKDKNSVIGIIVINIHFIALLKSLFTFTISFFV